MIVRIENTRVEYAPVDLSPRITVRFTTLGPYVMASAHDHVGQLVIAWGEGRTAYEALVDCKRKLRSLRTALDGADLEGA